MLQEVVADPEQLDANCEALEDIPEQERADLVQSPRIIMVFSPFQLDGPCNIEVRAETEAGELRGIGLRVREMPKTQDQGAP